MDCLALVEVLIAFSLKMADNVLETVKTLRIAKSNDIYSIIAMCVAIFIGTLMLCFIIKKAERDKLYIFDVISDNLDNGKQFADILRTKNVALNTTVVYNREMEKTLLVKIYCSSKKESRMVTDMLENKKNFKYNIYEPIED